MVQKKEPEILVSPKPQQTKNRAKVEGSMNQDDHNKGGVAGLRKTMKKMRSIKRISQLENLEAQVGRQCVNHNKAAAVRRKTWLARTATDGSPSYMKSTTSSDARKGKSGVSFPTSTTNQKEKKLKNSEVSSTNIPPKQVFKKKRSMRLVRSCSVKKCLGIPLFSTINVSRATCSSILKESTFPKELKLSPRATESEGTSAMKVCPYTYCSLNGHRHDSLPPLKSFISAKRRMMTMTQKTMKLKRIPSRKRKSNKTEKHADMEHREDYQHSLEIPPLSKETGDDFFTEIYHKSCDEFERMIFGENKTDAADIDNDDCGFDSSSEISSTQTSEKESKFEIAEFHVDEYHSEISSQSHLDQTSGVSDSYMEESKIYREYVAYDNQVQVSQEPASLHYFNGIKTEKNLLDDLSQNDIVAENEENEFFLEAKTMVGKKSMTECENTISNDENNREVLVCELNEPYEQDSHEYHPFSSSQSVKEEFQQDKKEYRDKVQEYQRPALLEDFDSIKSEKSMVNVMIHNTYVAADEQRECFHESRNLDRDESMTEYSSNIMNDEGNKEIQIFKQQNEVYKEDGHGHDPFSSSMSVKEDAQLDEKYCTDQTLREIVPHEQTQKIFKVQADEDQDFHGGGVSRNGAETHIDLAGNDIADDSTNVALSEPCEDIPDTTSQKFDSTHEELSEIHDQEKSTCKNTELEASQDIDTRDINIECRIPLENTEENGEYSRVKDTVNMLQISDPNHAFVETYQDKSEEGDEQVGQISDVETEVCVRENLPMYLCPAGTYQDNPPEKDTTRDSSDEIYSSTDPPHIGSYIEREDNFKECCRSQTENMTRNSNEENDDVMSPELQLRDNVKPHPKNESFPSGMKLVEEKSEGELQARFLISRTRMEEDEEAVRGFNPREPNFLPVEPEPDAETVDLRHQLMEERKNSEEWMVDYALQLVISRLGPVRKKKVELLVEAFESVSPTASKTFTAY